MDALHNPSTRLRALAVSQKAQVQAILSGGWPRRAVFGLLLFVLYSVARESASLSAPWTLAAWLVAVVFAVTFWLKPNPPVVLVCGLCGAAMQLLIRGNSNTGYIMSIAAIVLAARLEPTVSRIVALAAGLSYLLALVVATPHVDPGRLLTPAITLVFAYGASSSFQRLREEKRKTETLLQDVLAGRDAQVRAATLDERARLAREIHDILAHTLSALSLQLESVQLLVERQTQDTRTLAAVERASSLAREGLVETRRAVQALRGDSLLGPEALSRLAADFERDSSVPCRLTVEGDPVELSPEARLALYRTTQEALTNVRKHADASAVDLRLRYGEDGADLTIENQGTSRSSPIPGGGHGLNGMRERAELARGTLQAGPTPTGFRVHLWLPAEGINRPAAAITSSWQGNE